ncbi:MAG: Hexuronate transporter [Syntrophorhabdus sp. PtaU1.Bin050]|nr:MAG: Hexuronate transporter [Syntrophorhabdus sp. PtaU1.Bin050]
MAVPYQWVIVAILWSSHVIYFLNYMTIGTLSPFVQPEFHLSTTQIGMLCSAVTIGSLASNVPAGMLSDTFGAKRIMVFGLILIGCSELVICFLNSYIWIFLFLILVGMGIGCNQTPASKAIIMWFSLKGRATAMGIKQTGVTIGGIIASFLLPLMALHYGSWRYSFKVAGVAALLCAVLVLFFYVEPPHQLGDQSRDAISWKNNFLTLFKERDFIFIGLTGIFLMLIQFSFLAHFVLYATKVLNLPVKKAGAILGIAFFTGAVGRVAWSASSDYLFGAGRRIVLTIIGAAGAVVAIAFIPLSEKSSLLTIYALAALFGFTGLAWNAVYLTRVGEFPGRALAGVATGINFVIVNLGAIAGPPLFGYFVDFTGGYTTSWFFTGICLAMVAFLSEIQKKERMFAES